MVAQKIEQLETGHLMAWSIKHTEKFEGVLKKHGNNLQNTASCCKDCHGNKEVMCFHCRRDSH